ncbi:synaptotagmin-12-like [Lineus longissimus]|uniref:synaptotagmin-12-like n=1 Tax=Lineus longissimus TaxID=88925 RepID=UPI002B4E240B
MLAEWEVALILIVFSILVAVGIGLFCRFVGIRRVVSFFATDEEKAVLTKHDQNGLMHGSESDFVLDNSGKFMEYDTIKSDPGYMDLDKGRPKEAQPPARIQTNVLDSPRDSPTASIGSTSDFDPMVQNLPRAASCESLASDTSVMELQPDIPAIGQIEVGLEYDKEVSELVVGVIQARDLPANEYSGTLDSYVKVYLQPNTEGKGQTKIQKKTINPVFKERFLFNVEPYDLGLKTVQFHIYACDKYARHKMVGEVEIKLSDLELSQPLRIWLSLRDIDEKPADLGELMFSLSYLPTAERLTVVVVKARNLKWCENKRSGDSFVKVFLLQNGRKVSKKKTSTKKDEAQPVFNEAMIFSVPASALPNLQLRFTVAEQEQGGRINHVGHVIVGSQTAGTELSHWNQMMTSLRKPVSMWHSLIRHK